MNKVTFDRILIAVIFIVIVTMQVRLAVKDKEIAKLEQSYSELKLSQDTLSKSNKEFIETVNITITNMDSLYLLSKNNNEDEIKYYWDSVYSDLINDSDGRGKMSNLLRQFTNK